MGEERRRREKKMKKKKKKKRKKNSKSRFFPSRGGYIKLRYIAMLYTHHRVGIIGSVDSIIWDERDAP